MFKITFFSKVLCCYLASTLAITGVFSSVAQAGMIETNTEFSQSLSQNGKERLQTLLARADIQQHMSNLGLSADEAKARVKSLSDEEATQLANRLDEAVAAGALGTVVVAILIIFLVLLVTDVLGLTKVFPFTRSVAKK